MASGTFASNSSITVGVSMAVTGDRVRYRRSGLYVVNPVSAARRVRARWERVARRFVLHNGLVVHLHWQCGAPVCGVTEFRG
ncbi:hypothetical protein [Halopiger xanaduensis]|uniref:hypothetical protein n=1 Tax=Halopiger xanaduensis TaxID=387343 RepID=UPI00373FCACD